MSLLTFQRALADFAASPDLCRAAIADPVPVLRSYELSSRERLRLASMVRDRLMATNCVLYRVNRVTPIYVFFPMTCQVLGRELRRELESAAVDPTTSPVVLGEITKLCQLAENYPARAEFLVRSYACFRRL